MICLRKIKSRMAPGASRERNRARRGLPRLGAWRGKVPWLKHQKLPRGLGKRSGKFDSQRDQQAKYAAQQCKTEVLEGEPERDSTDGQCVERTSSRVVGRGHAGSNEARHYDASQKQGDRDPAKELQDRKNSLDLLYFRSASPVCRLDGGMVVRLLRPMEHKCSFLIADISVHWFSQALRWQETCWGLGGVRARVPKALSSERLERSWGSISACCYQGVASRRLDIQVIH